MSDGHVSVQPPKPMRRFDLGRYEGEVDPTIEKSLLTWIVPDPLARARAGEILSSRPHRVTSAVELPCGVRVLLKAERARRGLAGVMARLGPSQSLREFRVLRHLEGLGIPVPRALAMGEARQAGLLSGAFFVASFLPRVESVLRRFTDMPHKDVRRPWLLRLGAYLRALHDHGLDHLDLHADNLLIAAGSPAVSPLYIVDLHRARIAGVVSPRARRRGLARFLQSLDPLFRSGEARTLVEGYYGDAAAPERELAALAREIHRLHRRARIRLARRCTHPSRTWTAAVGSGRGMRHVQFSELALEQAVAQHQAALDASDARLAKRGRKGAVTCHGQVVVKEHWPADLAGRLRNLLAPLRFRRGLVNAHLLHAAGVPVARPLAWLARGGRRYALYEDLSRFDRFDLLAAAIWREGSPHERERFIYYSAAWLADLHARGVYHGDLKGINVRAERRPDLLRFHLIDVDHVRFFDRSLDRRRRVKNLAQLAASIPRVVSRTDRLRWYRRYAEASNPGASLREINADVREALAQKRVVVDEPIE